MVVTSKSFRHMGLAATCPEGSRLVGATLTGGGQCECYPGRVWMPDGSKCVSPQSPAFSGSITWQEGMEGHTPDTYGQQELLPSVKRYIEDAGHTISCKISESWDFGPQGGQPARMCSIDGGPFEHAAYLINLNPFNALASLGSNVALDATRQLVQTYGGTWSGSGASGGTSQGGAPFGDGSTEEHVEEEPSDDIVSDLQDFINGELIEGIPNIALLGGAAVGAYFLFSGRGN